jgi:RNA polymerase sigma-70 factor, ECF subfamily
MANNAFECELESGIEILDEDRLLVRAARNDTAAAGRLFDKYYDAIFGYIYHCTFDHAVAEDLASNVFLAAFRHLGRFQWRPIHFRAWIYRIATNEVRMHYRRAKRIRIFRREAVSGERDTAPPASDTPSAAEEYRLLHEALQHLKPKYRTVITLRYFENKTMSEISEVTGQKEGTLRCQLHRGLAQLQDVLSQYGVWPH